MIKLNRIADSVLDNALKSERVTLESGRRAYLCQCLVRLNKTFDCTAFKHAGLARWSEYEVGAADTLCWLVAFLKRIGCEDIEQLLKDVIAYRSEHPDAFRRAD